MTDQPKPPDNAFHAHLDECAQCREHPMELCPVGAAKLREAAVGSPMLRFEPSLPRRVYRGDGRCYGNGPFDRDDDEPGFDG